MKRLLSLLLAAALCLTLAACGGGKTDSAPSDAPAQDTASADAQEGGGTDTAEAQDTAAAPSFTDVAVGDHVTLGTYEDTPLNWTVIHKGVGTALLLCDNVLQRMNFGQSDTVWKDSEVCKYLNRDFYATVFSSQERDLIAQTEITTTRFDPDSYTSFEEQSADRVFLLSAPEFLLYVTPIQDLCYGVPLESIREDVYMADVENPGSIQQSCSWDLRDDADRDSYHVYSVDGWDGRLNGYGSEKNGVVNVRPALWVYTDQTLAEGWQSGQAELPADETLNAAIAGLHKGDQVSFGRFYYRDFRDGKQDITWTVLDESDDALLLFSDEVFSAEKFNEEEDTSVTWETSSLRALLNSDHFIDQFFTPWERSKIRLTHNSTSNGDPMWERDGGAETDDLLFVLDQEEIVNYLPEDGDRAIEEASYWLRNPDFAPGFFCIVNYGGPITPDEATSRHEVRVAMWINK